MMEGNKMDKLRIVADRRDVRYEEKSKSSDTNNIIPKYWKEEREQYYEEEGINVRELRTSDGGEPGRSLVQVDRSGQKHYIYI